MLLTKITWRRKGLFWLIFYHDGVTALQELAVAGYMTSIVKKQ